MADLIIKPSAVADSFKMNDANSSANTILTIEGQTESGSAANLLGGRIIYGKGVNETAGTITQSGAIMTLDLATGTFFSHTMETTPITHWKILHLPATNTIAAWVVKLTNFSTARTNAWLCQSGPETSTYDKRPGTAWQTDGSHFGLCLPVFNWAGADHVITATNDATDIIAFWTLGGDNPIIYGTISGQVFA